MTLNYLYVAYLFKEQDLLQKQTAFKEKCSNEPRNKSAVKAPIDKSVKSQKDVENKPKSESSVRKSDNRVDRVMNHWRSSKRKAYCLFLKAVLPMFTGPNVLLQTEEPLVHRLHSIMQNFIRDILSRFVKPAVIVKYDSNLKDIPFTEGNMKEKSDIYIGEKCREFLELAKEMSKSKFLDSVKSFYKKAAVSPT